MSIMAGKARKRTRGKNSANSKVAKKQKIEAKEDEEINKSCDSPTKVEYSKKLLAALSVEFPDDFYFFYDFCKALNSSSVRGALADSLNLELCGPYDILVGKLASKNGNGKESNEKGEQNENDDDDSLKFHLHSRFYYDPPEFMTLIKESTSRNGFHIGYIRDDPKDLPSVVASNSADEGCVFTICGDNIFAAVNCFAQDLLKNTADKSRKAEIKRVIAELKRAAKECGQKLDLVTSRTKARKKRVVSGTFHKAGIVVPLDANEVGYRPLNLTDNALKKLLDRISTARDEEDRNKYFDELHDLITLVQFANDECDYGMGLELGIDLFSHGNEAFKGMIQQLLPLAYSLLGRDLYGKIIERHMKAREKVINEI